MNYTLTTSLPTSSPKQLITLLHVPLKQKVDDLEFVLQQSQEFDLTAKSYSALVISSTRFQR
jgi:hypothetical protein